MHDASQRELMHAAVSCQPMKVGNEPHTLNMYNIEVGFGYLELPDIKLLFEDVRRISSCSKGTHIGQIPTVTTHGFNDEHTALCATC